MIALGAHVARRAVLLVAARRVGQAAHEVRCAWRAHGNPRIICTTWLAMAADRHLSPCRCTPACTPPGIRFVDARPAAVLDAADRWARDLAHAWDRGDWGAVAAALDDMPDDRRAGGARLWSLMAITLESITGLGYGRATGPDGLDRIVMRCPATREEGVPS